MKYEMNPGGMLWVRNPKAKTTRMVGFQNTEGPVCALAFLVAEPECIALQKNTDCAIVNENWRLLQKYYTNWQEMAYFERLLDAILTV